MPLEQSNYSKSADKSDCDYKMSFHQGQDGAPDTALRKESKNLTDSGVAKQS